MNNAGAVPQPPPSRWHAMRTLPHTLAHSQATFDTLDACASHLLNGVDGGAQTNHWPRSTRLDAFLGSSSDVSGLRREVAFRVPLSPSLVRHDPKAPQ